MAKRKFTKYPSNYVGAASETSGAAMRKKKREAEQRGREGAKLLATDGDWELWTPKTFEGSSYLAKLYSKEKAVWDTAYDGSRHYWDRYNELGPLYIFVNKNTGEKYQSHPATNSWFYDMYDHSKGKQAFIDFIDEHPAFAQFFDIDDDVNACGDINASTSINASFYAYDTIPVVEDGDWAMYAPATFEACQRLSEGAQWATGYEQYYFDRYTDKGPLYIFVNESTGEKYQSHPATASWFYDIYDRDHGKQALEDFCCKHPAFAQFFDVSCDGDVNACDVMSSNDIYADSLASDNLGVRSLDYDTLRERLIENYWSGYGVDEVFWDWSGGEIDVDTFINQVATAWHNNDSGNSFIEDIQNAIELAEKIGYDTSNASVDIEE